MDQTRSSLSADRTNLEIIVNKDLTVQMLVTGHPHHTQQGLVSLLSVREE